ncbi:MAG: acetylglutamate kinase [Aquificaceae bacterium]|uniref:acetylglutamate kinase n=1 Tax=Hydrogenobacter sp. Uz 6-8 TaxID=3384828 RepID=UPI0038FCA62E
MIEKLVEKAKILQSALPYIREFYGKTFVIKYGGSAMTEEGLRESFARDVVLLRYVGIRVVVVHGGGPQISHTLEKFGVKPHFVGGMRRTDEETMHVVEMVLSGDINKDIVALINTHSGQNIYAVGLSGRDGQLIRAKKLDKERYFRELGLDVPEEDIGFVGEVVGVNTDLLQVLMEKGYIPIIAPVGVGERGEAYNINADVVASEVAGSLMAEKLIFLTDTEGVKDAQGRLIPTLSRDRVHELIQQGVIKGGMLPKIRSAIRALQSGVKKVHIIDGRTPHSILLEVFTQEGIGTEIVE